MACPTTSLYAGFFAVVYIVLAYRVTQHRHRTKIGLGTGDDAGLEAAVRVHANFAEYVPFALLLMALWETSAPSWGVHALGAALVTARLSHASGLGKSRGRSRGRYWGTALTFAVVATAGVANLVSAVASLLA